MNKWENTFKHFITVKFNDIKLFMDEEGTEEQKETIKRMVSKGVVFPAIKSYFYSDIYKPYCKQYEKKFECNGHIYLLAITDQQKDGSITRAFKIGETTNDVLTRARQVSATNYFGEKNQVNILGYYNINSTKTERLLLESIARLALERAAVYKFQLAGNDFFPCHYDSDKYQDIYDYVKAIFFNSMNGAIKDLNVDGEMVKPLSGEKLRATRKVSNETNFVSNMATEEKKMYEVIKWQNYFGV